MGKHILAWILAHPDDESFGSACAIKEASMRGDTSLLLVATAGEAGKTGYLGPMSKEELAKKRKEELEEAGKILGLSVINHLDYPDGRLAEVEQTELMEKIIQFLNEYQVQVVITFGEDGVSGHPDHIAIHQATRSAIVSGACPSVQKLYYYYNSFSSAEGKGHEPAVRVAVANYWDTKVKALLAHQSQLKSIERVFGSLNSPDSLPSPLREEAFVLAWERGQHFPKKKEQFLTDHLH